MRIALLIAGLSLVVSGHLIGDGSSQLHKRRLSSIQLPRGGDSWACGAEELNKLESTIDEARKLARNAAGVLAIGGSENSAAYTKWFGKGNANTKTRISLKMNNYDSLVNDLRFPDNTVAFDGKTLDPQGLTYVCWPQDEHHCELGFIAGVIRPGYHPGLRTSFRGHVLAMCPKFFNLASQDEVAAALKRESPTLRLSAALTLVHEMQHVNLTTGNDRLCDDQIEQSRIHGRGVGCYDIKCCSSIPDENKIQNAQNLALFALDVAAFPERAGVGGGFVLAPSGALLPIAAGSTAVVSASTAANGAEEFKLEEEKKEDPEIPSVTPTISAPASTASDDPCSLATQSDAPEPATPDAPDFAFKDFVFLPGPEPTVFSSMTKPPTTTTKTTTTTTKAAAKTSAPAVPPPLPCYNFDNASYGWCCRGPDSPCEKDLGTCYFDGTGGSNVLPNSAACPPPEGARH
ncbi:hypothetical protein CTRI78_v010877 [Colletotrichum trifolii]|uniref:Lysine-specific metallo-endopeptidase domain-containing protein n=1 Tax=Colletotrichum trifolii TaxID=5466 RepID=A0A4R8QHE9_COLTR|nr:hypothetical protein CTRI78_v010877 [Colletotrichum trifolii]